ncbi:MAG: hypothetical protein WBX16_00410 [Candidatus Acidiferrales bacterium]
MNHANDRPLLLASGGRKGPSKALVARIRRRRRPAAPTHDDYGLSDAYREVLRDYQALVSSGGEPGLLWRRLVHEALGFLGGQADRHTSSLAEYDHRRYGPFLGVSDEGGAARAIRRAAFATPKTRALGHKTSPLAVGVALDAERLGSVGEVPVGPDEFAQVWSECVCRTLMTTNVGSRANLRLYRRAPLVTINAGKSREALDAARVALSVAFKPFVEAPGGPRPLVVFVEFALGSKRGLQEQRKLLRSLQQYVRTGGIAVPRIHHIGLNVRIGWGPKGGDSALRAIDLASSVGISQVSIDGVVRKDADSVVSLPGLLNYLPPGLVVQILRHAQSKRVQVRSINEADPDTVAREIWSGLNTARAMGLDLGKYGLFPLSLEECDIIIGHVQRWFPDWSAAPVFYVDQGIISRSRVYIGDDTAKGIEAWLRIVAKHKVRIVLIDTVDKSQGWRILKADNDPKGILESRQIAHLSAFGQELGIKVLWAGGITLDQAYEFGKLGVFGIYVTTAASEAAPVTGEYRNDPALASEKRPTFAGVVKVKTLLEGGFLAGRLGTGSPRIRKLRESLRVKIELAGVDPVALSRVLPAAWRSWWRWGSK